MGDFPRWIDREDVDSPAMFSAYLSYENAIQAQFSYKTGAYRPVWDGHLHMINHRKPCMEGICIPRDVSRVRQVDCQKYLALAAMRRGAVTSSAGLVPVGRNSITLGDEKVRGRRRSATMRRLPPLRCGSGAKLDLKRSRHEPTFAGCVQKIVKHIYIFSRASRHVPNIKQS